MVLSCERLRPFEREQVRAELFFRRVSTCTRIFSHMRKHKRRSCCFERRLMHLTFGKWIDGKIWAKFRNVAAGLFGPQNVGVRWGDQNGVRGPTKHDAFPALFQCLCVN
jgi:hypothetical protein